MYKAQQAEAEAADSEDNSGFASGDAADSDEDTVVDADFEEVDDDKKDQSSAS